MVLTHSRYLLHSALLWDSKYTNCGLTMGDFFKSDPLKHKITTREEPVTCTACILMSVVDPEEEDE